MNGTGLGQQTEYAPWLGARRISQTPQLSCSNLGATQVTNPNPSMTWTPSHQTPSAPPLREIQIQIPNPRRRDRPHDLVQAPENMKPGNRERPSPRLHVFPRAPIRYHCLGPSATNYTVNNLRRWICLAFWLHAMHS